MPDTLAHADRAGVIRFTQSKCPSGCLPIARGDDTLMERIRAQARLAYDNKTLLVPGVPEAQSELAALDALMAFRARFAKETA